MSNAKPIVFQDLKPKIVEFFASYHDKSEEDIEVLPFFVRADCRDMFHGDPLRGSKPMIMVVVRGQRSGLLHFFDLKKVVPSVDLDAIHLVPVGLQESINFKIAALVVMALSLIAIAVKQVCFK